MGRKQTPETRDKIAAALKGHAVSHETRAAVAASNRRRAGPAVSADTRARMSASHKGKKFSPKHRANLSASQKGQKRTPEARARMSASKKGSPIIPPDLDPQLGPILDRQRAGRPEPATPPEPTLATIRLTDAGYVFIDDERIPSPLTGQQRKLVDALLDAGWRPRLCAIAPIGACRIAS